MTMCADISIGSRGQWRNVSPRESTEVQEHIKFHTYKSRKVFIFLIIKKVTQGY